MSKLPVMDAKEAGKILISLGFELTRTKGSHKIYIKGKERVVIPYHSGKDLNPKIVKIILNLIEKKHSIFYPNKN